MAGCFGLFFAALGYGSVVLGQECLDFPADISDSFSSAGVGSAEDFGTRA